MKNKEIFLAGLIANNPVFVLALGLCSSLAVTTSVRHAITMSIVCTAALVSSSVTVSLLRRLIPSSFRLIAYMLVISTAVTIVEKLLSSIAPEVSGELGPYVPLVITNCIILGRIESFASNHGMGQSAADAMGVSCGYSVFLLLMATFREILGSGTWWNIKVTPDAFKPCAVFTSAPGAFLVFAVFMAILHQTGIRRPENRSGPGSDSVRVPDDNRDAGMTRASRALEGK